MHEPRPTTGAEARAGVVVLGGGAAGATAVRTIVRENPSTPVLLVTGESSAPYDRTELSKALLTGERFLPRPLFPDELAGRNVSVRTGATAVDIDLEKRVLGFGDRSQQEYGTLLLATGASSRTLELPGVDLEGVHHIREVAGTLALRDAIPELGRLVVIGGGLIGLEVAAAARSHGCEVTVVEVADRLMERILPPAIAEFIADEHINQGVHVVMGARPTAFSDRGDGHVASVVLADGQTLPADAVVIAIGSVPRTALAEAAGLAVDDGVLVDPHMRTSDPHVLAAGDLVRVVTADGTITPRTEAWTPAMMMGEHAARSILGPTAPYLDVPWMWSDQYDLRLQAAGGAIGDLELVSRGNIDEPTGLAVFGLADGHIRGVVGVSRGTGIGRTVRAAMLLMQHGIEVGPDQLMDTTVELRGLVPRR